MAGSLARLRCINDAEVRRNTVPESSHLERECRLLPLFRFRFRDIEILANSHLENLTSVLEQYSSVRARLAGLCRVRTRLHIKDLCLLEIYFRIHTESSIKYL